MKKIMDSSASTSCHSHWSSLAKPALSAALAVGVLTAGQAEAFVVKVDGQYWDVTTFTGSYNDNKSKFNTLANGGVMPWWVLPTSDYTFLTSSQWEFINSLAHAVNDKLGLPNIGPWLTPGAPIFGYRYRDNRDGGYFGGGVLSLRYVVPGVENGLDPLEITSSATWTWAQASPYASPAPVPGPLPALGVAAAFGFSRKLRKRIKASKPEGVSTTTV
jgi:hypothetical protein